MQRSAPQREPPGLRWSLLVQARAHQGLGSSTRRVRAFGCRRLLENSREAHLSAASEEPPQDARLPCPHEDGQWPSCHQQPPPQGSRASGRHRIQEVSRAAVPPGALGPAGMRRSMRFTPSDRLRKRFEFRRLRDQGRRVHTRSFVLLIGRSATPRPRMGITVSRQVGNAVRRNRIKRLVREAFRQHRSLLPASCDLVVIAKANCSVARLADVETELRQAASALRAACAKTPQPTGARP